MNVLTDYQIIKQGGRPAFVVIPYEDFVEWQKQQGLVEDGLIPQDVVVKHAVDGVPLVKAWRQYFHWTQEKLADKAGMNQSALARIESGVVQPREDTLKKLAAAMNLTIEQLLET